MFKFALITLCVSAYVIVDGRPAESNIQPATGNNRAKLLLDTLGTLTNAQKTAEGASKVAVTGIDEARNTLNNNVNEIVGHGRNALDENMQVTSNFGKSVMNATGDFITGVSTWLFSGPKVIAESAQTVLRAK